MSENKITAAYERLSVGDEQRSGESVSIQNQKSLLEQYARNHGFKHIVHYTDDDESGRFFDRPGYVQMMDDVESGKIGIILMKDSSRLGRDYIQVGLAMDANVKHKLKKYLLHFCEQKTDTPRAEMVSVFYFNRSM